DNDGFPDFLVTGYGGLRFFHNLGDGTFEEVSQSAGLTDTLWSSSAAWGDLNGDGVLDLYVAHYVNWSWENHPVCRGYRTPRDVCSPQQFAPLPDTVYLSQGDGTFREATKEMGLRSDGKGLGVLMADLDLDGRIDVYVGNDTVPNFLYRNTKNGKLEDESLTSGASRNSRGLPDGSMGVDVGDYNRDGRPDLWVANYENETFALYRNEGDGFFQHVSQAMGVTAVGQLAVGWGTVFADFDLDGDEDLFTSNGHVVRYPHNVPVNQPPFLFENMAGEHFVNVAPSAGDYLKAPHRGRGLAAGDLDRDGDWDLVISHQNEPVSLLSNESPTAKNHWLTIHLTGVISNRDAVGTRVTLQTANGEFSRQRKGGGSYASTHAPDLHFGLGTSEHIERLVVHWPSGRLTELENLSADQHLDLVEPTIP
ncbi:MAG: CRTAC1 family protein, partial [Planctomycetaceae bacterium]|nr:CRTAC1 family protein [Planctomycetaceae bacterium]